MVSKGVDAAWVAQMVFDQQPLGRLRLLSRTLETLELSPRDKVASVVVTREMFRQTHTGVEDVEGFANYARSVCGVEVGVLLREEGPGRYRLALRSKGRVDVAEIAASVMRHTASVEMTWVCGGGHVQRVRSLFPDDLQARLEVLPWRPQSELIQLYDSHGVFLYPSFYEGAGKA